ncbi:hypothetical protein [Halalkalicoccus tibetensis]|uniref:Gins51 C-terminal domain-containing protein n=1 Tax=Halalkalicoccus tibetensis TaxID=175632 RepID=A0ABD5UZS1_9EURY
MDLDELQTVKDTEREKDSLQHLPDSFYTDVAEHIESLKEDRKDRAAATDDPFDDPEVQRLTGEIDSTEQVVESIYERRVGKLVKLASFAAADMPADEEGLTSEERDLFSDLVARIKENRAHVLDVLAGEVDAETDGEAPTEAGETADVPAGPEPESEPESADPVEPEPDPGHEPAPGPENVPEPDGETSVSAADLMGDGSETEEAMPANAGAVTDDAGTTAGTASEPSADDGSDEETSAEPEPGESDGVGRATLRITRDVGEIVGVDDREYDLATDDVVTLPEANAGALVEREAAERLE